MPYDHINELTEFHEKAAHAHRAAAGTCAAARLPTMKAAVQQTVPNCCTIVVAEPEDLDVVHFGERHINGQFGGQVFVVHRILMKFSEDRIASFTTSFGATDRSVYEVIGTKGVVKMDPAYELAETLKSEVTIDGRTTKKAYKKRDQFAPELVYFSDCILKNKEPEPSGQEGLVDVRIVQAMLKSAETNRAVSVTPVKIRRRPGLDQEISREAVTKAPELIRAAAPGAE